MPADQWDAERVVDADAAAVVIAEQFPDLRGLPVIPLGIGWDNTVHAVGGRWAFRFPRRTMALAGITREIAVLPWLAERLPLPIPAPAYVGEVDGWPFFGAPLVPGWELVTVPEAHRAPAASAVGAFLRVLHDLTPAPEIAQLLPLDPMQRANPTVRAAKAREPLSRVDPSRRLDVEPLFLAAERLGPSTARPVVSHGDLHVRHLLVDEGQASGVIDWGDACLADPAVDVSLAYGSFAGPARAAFFTAYGDIDEETELRARVLAVSLCAMLTEYAASADNAILHAECLRGIHRAVGD